MRGTFLKLFFLGITAFSWLLLACAPTPGAAGANTGTNNEGVHIVTDAFEFDAEATPAAGGVWLIATSKDPLCRNRNVTFTVSGLLDGSVYNPETNVGKSFFQALPAGDYSFTAKATCREDTVPRLFNGRDFKVY